MRREDTDNTRKGRNYEVKRKILVEILKNPLSRTELKDRLTEELGISRKDIDYHVQRGENSLLTKGIVKEENGNLSPVWDSRSILEIVKFLYSDNSLKGPLNRALPESYQIALFTLGRIMSEEYNVAIDNWKNSKIGNLEVVVETLLRAYAYDSFLDDELSRPRPISPYDFLSPSSYPYNPERLKGAEQVFEHLPQDIKKLYLEQKEMEQKYLDIAIKRFRKDLLDPVLSGAFTGGMQINYDHGKRELLSKLQQVGSILDYLAGSDLDRILQLSDKIKSIFGKTYRLPKNEVRKLTPKSRNRLFGLKPW